MRVLVIDDSRATRMILGRILGEMGCEVIEADNGLEGLERLKEVGGADLALVDWIMPEMSGLEFVRTIRANLDYQKLPLMMVTTERSMERVATALAAGANEYLMEPITKELVVDKLRLL